MSDERGDELQSAGEINEQVVTVVMKGIIQFCKRLDVPTDWFFANFKLALSDPKFSAKVNWKRGSVYDMGYSWGDIWAAFLKTLLSEDENE